jgi:mug protein
MEIETHPFEPWLPSNAKLLMLGTFPPAPKRWAMEWYYPNYTNDMWRIFGLAFFEDKMHFIDEANKTYKLQELKQFLKEKGVAIFDTALRIRRTTGTASDKDLEIVEPADLDKMLRSLPECKSILAAGQLATKVFTEHYKIDARKMKMGEYRTFSFEGRTLKLYREPSSSRAYPMRVEEKATYYKQMFKETHIL